MFSNEVDSNIPKVFPNGACMPSSVTWSYVLRIGSPKQRSSVCVHWFFKAEKMLAAYWLSAAGTRDVSKGSCPMQRSHPKEVSDNLNAGMLTAGNCYPMDEGASVLFKGADVFPY